MIILGKDKVDERYNIDDNGVITDLQGNVQKTKIHKDNRAYFKGQCLHRILMWTKFGYKNLIIHHKDRNPLNNNINNLIYLTRAEHSSIHFKGRSLSQDHKNKIANTNKGLGKGRTLSIETRNKMSESRKGEKNCNYKKIFSIETRKKMSEAKKLYYQKKKEGIN